MNNQEVIENHRFIWKITNGMDKIKKACHKQALQPTGCIDCYDERVVAFIITISNLFLQGDYYV